jgi:hypothetical protein
MSKGSRRRLFKSLANRKRTPESWFAAPIASTKAGSNKVAALVPIKGEKRRRDA